MDSGLPTSLPPSLDGNQGNGDASTAIIRHLQALQRDTEEIKTSAECISKLEEQIAAVLTVQGHMLRSLHRLQREQKKKKTTSRRRHSSSVSSSCQSKQPTKEDITTIVHLPAALQASIIKIMNNLTFANTKLPDQLIEQDCLSEDECEYIRNLATPKDQIRSLVRKLKGRGPEKIQTFLDLVQLDQPHLVKDILNTLETIKAQSKEHKCPVCLMVKMVEVQDIADLLWQEGVINDDLHGHITEIERAYRYRQYYWTLIINGINNADHPATAKLVLIQALEAKYEYISDLFKISPPDQMLECCCHKKRKYKSAKRSFDGSQTDISEYGKNVPQLSQIDTSDTEFSSLDIGARDFIFSASNRNRYVSDERTVASSFHDKRDCTKEDDHDRSRSRDRSRHTSGQFAPEPAEQCESLNSLASIVNVGESLLTPVVADANTMPTFDQTDSRTRTKPQLQRSDTCSVWPDRDSNSNAVKQFDQMDGQRETRPDYTHSMSNTSTVKQTSEGEESQISSTTDNSTSPDSNTTTSPQFSLNDARNQSVSDKSEELYVPADDEGDVSEVAKAKKKFSKRLRQKRIPRQHQDSLPTGSPRTSAFKRQTSLPSAFTYTKTKTKLVGEKKVIVTMARRLGVVPPNTSKKSIFQTADSNLETNVLGASNQQKLRTKKDDVQETESVSIKFPNIESKRDDSTRPCDDDTTKNNEYEVDEVSARQLEVMEKLKSLSVGRGCADTESDLPLEDVDTDGVGNMTM